MQERRRSHSLASPSSWLSVSSLSVNPSNLTVEGERVKYTGPGTSDKDAASVRADHPVPFGVGTYYFEIEVINKGRNGYVGLGFSAPTVPLNRLPGWEPCSYGYHGDDGHVFYESGRGQEFGPTFGKGDVIGALLNKADRTICFTKNGINLGVAFTDVKEEVLFPTVGMRTPDEEIIANFGARPFKADYEAMQAVIRNSIRRHIDAQDAEQFLQEQEASHPVTMESVVMGYLVDSGHWKTAQALASSSATTQEELSSSQILDIQIRRQVQECITFGSCQEAVTLINNYNPSLLHREPALNFKLHCMVFMQMIEAGRLDEAIVFGKKILVALAASEANMKQLSDALTLMTMERVQDCPNYVPLMGPAARLALSKEINTAILRLQGRPGLSLLESSLKHMGAMRRELEMRGNASVAMFDSDEYLDLKSKSA